MRKLWFFWSEKEQERYNTKRQQIIRRELYKGVADRTRAENKERLEAFKIEYENLL